MTVNLGPAAGGPAAELVGRVVELRVVSLARGPTAVAVGVEGPVPSHNARPHITLAVHTAAGGRSRDANGLTDWAPVEPFTLHGRVQEID